MVHIPTNDAAAPDHVCPGIDIHAIYIVQPPGIGMPPIADIDAHHAIVAAPLATKSSAEMPRNAFSEVRSEVTCPVTSNTRLRRDVGRSRSMPSNYFLCR